MLNDGYDNVGNSIYLLFKFQVHTFLNTFPFDVVFFFFFFSSERVFDVIQISDLDGPNVTYVYHTCWFDNLEAASHTNINVQNFIVIHAYDSGSLSLFSLQSKT